MFPLQSLADVHVYVSKHVSKDSRGWNDGRTQDRYLSRVMETEQGIGFDVLRTWAI
jgi:hypothetical protein